MPVSRAVKPTKDAAREPHARFSPSVPFFIEHEDDVRILQAQQLVSFLPSHPLLDGTDLEHQPSGIVPYLFDGQGGLGRGGKGRW